MTMKKTRSTIASLALGLALNANVWAQAPVTSLLACRSIQDDTARLACFDRESAAIAVANRSPATTPTAPAGATSAVPTTSAPAVASTSTPPPTAVSPTTPAPPTAASPATPTAPTPLNAAASAATPGAGSALDPAATFGLKQQTIAERETAAGLRKKDLQSITAHISRISSPGSGRVVFDLDNHQVWQQVGAEGDLMAKPGDEVKIWRGMLGSFWLQASTGRGCKVTRLE